MSTKVSIVIPVYNVEVWLERCLDSVLQQTYRELEIIMVNDGATDHSEEICRRYLEQDDRLRYVYQENQGLSAARNRGQQEATGDYVIFIDSDDYIHPDMIALLVDRAESSGAEVTVCGIMNVYQNSSTPQYQDTEFEAACDKEDFLRWYLVGDRVPGSICNKLLKKSLTDKLAFPVGKIYEDANYTFDLVRLANSFYVTTRPYYYYFHRSNSITTSAYSPKMLECIRVYREFAAWIKAQYPQLRTEAAFRLHYAYFVVFDAMLRSPDFRQFTEYRTVRDHLKRYAMSISRNHFFAKGRRISALALRIGVPLYRILLKLETHKNKKIH
ncbi:MAG: glycosyltransferase family 2 protein [Lachnospiraceae bacterium]|nr:glycosyltransferase family 2 protein [Lachnospiraceae bacterium]MDY5742909.1 glycosyltransferase family 2 protein [Lachnospiraceae bacterium]